MTTYSPALALLFLFAVASAEAQCPGGRSAMPIAPRSVGVAPLPACMPTAGSVVIESNAAGTAIAWWCKGEAEPKLYLYAARWEFLTTPKITELLSFFSDGATPASVQALQTKYQTENILDICDVWGPAWPKIVAAKPK